MPTLKEKKHSFNVAFATQYDIEDAILYQYCEWCTLQKMINYDYASTEFIWFNTSVNRLHKIYPYLSPKSISDSLVHLLMSDLIAIDQDLWFPHYEEAEQLTLRLTDRDWRLDQEEEEEDE